MKRIRMLVLRLVLRIRVWNPAWFINPFYSPPDFENLVVKYMDTIAAGNDMVEHKLAWHDGVPPEPKVQQSHRYLVAIHDLRYDYRYVRPMWYQGHFAWRDDDGNVPELSNKSIYAWAEWPAPPDAFDLQKDRTDSPQGQENIDRENDNAN